jgi:thioredoxin 1
MSVKNITDDSFEKDVLESNKPVLVDFWAPWCQPCKMLSPIIDEIAKDMPEITVAKINIDENSNTPGQYGVRGIPTLLLFKQGSLAGTQVGQLSKTDLAGFIEEHLKDD